MTRLNSVRKGLVTGLPLTFSAGFFGIIFGFTGASGQFSLVFVSAMSYIIFAGSAQFITLLLFIQQEQVLAIIIAATLLNLRHLIYGGVLNDLLTFTGWKRLVPAYFLTDEAFLVTMLVNKEVETDDTEGYILDWVLIGAGVTLWVVWNLATIAGYLLYQVSNDLIALPENFVISASFVGFLVEQVVKYPDDRILIGFCTFVSLLLGSFVSTSILLIIIMISGALFAMTVQYIRHGGMK